MSQAVTSLGRYCEMALTVLLQAAAEDPSTTDPLARVLAIAAIGISLLALVLKLLDYRRGGRVEKAAAAAEQRRVEAELAAGARVRLELIQWFDTGAGATEVSYDGYHVPGAPFSLQLAKDTIANGPPSYIGVVARNSGRASIEVRHVRLEARREGGQIASRSGPLYGDPLPGTVDGLSSRRWGLDLVTMETITGSLGKVDLQFAADLGDGTTVRSDPFNFDVRPGR